MRAILTSALAVSFVLGLAGCPSQGGSGQRTVVPTTEDEKTLYSIGLSMGQQLKVFGLTEAELQIVERGLEDQVMKKQPLVELREYGPKIGALARQRGSVVSEAEKQKGAAYLAQQEKEPGAQKLPSGVLYIEQRAGTGANPGPTSKVKVNYRGTLMDGTEFDSSYKRNQPAEFPLNGVVKCWTEGMQKLKVGGKAKLVCPSDTAYGDHGAPPNIPGGATLTFEVELLEILPDAPPPPPPGAPAPGAPQGMAPKGHPAVVPPPAPSAPKGPPPAATPAPSAPKAPPPAATPPPAPKN